MRKTPFISKEPQPLPRRPRLAQRPSDEEREEALRDLAPDDGYTPEDF